MHLQLFPKSEIFKIKENKKKKPAEKRREGFLFLLESDSATARPPGRHTWALGTSSLRPARGNSLDTRRTLFQSTGIS